jgi:Kef-type K+ transport system membrane component KefB
VLKAVGEIGLALFMFTVGWTLDLEIVRRRGRAAALVSVASIVPPLLLGLGLATYLHPRHDVVDGATVAFAPFALFVAASMAVTAFPVLARIPAETGLARTALGALVVSAAAVDDVVGWSMVAVVLAALASDGPWDYVRVAAESAFFAGAVIVLARPLLRRLLRITTVAPEAIVVPIALAGAAATDAIGIHAVFGAFMVGAAMPRPVEGTAVAHVAVVVGVLAPVYFVTSGMAVDVPGLQAGDLADLVVIVAVACAGKFAGAYGGARAVGVQRRDAAAIGVLMNTRGLIDRAAHRGPRPRADRRSPVHIGAFDHRGDHAATPQDPAARPSARKRAGALTAVCNAIRNPSPYPAGRRVPRVIRARRARVRAPSFRFRRLWASSSRRALRCRSMPRECIRGPPSMRGSLSARPVAVGPVARVDTATRSLLRSPSHRRQLRLRLRPGLVEQDPLRPSEGGVGLLRAVADRREPDASELAEGAHHVEDDAGLARLVEVQAAADRDVEEVVRGQAAEQVGLEVVGRDEVLLAVARRHEQRRLWVVSAVGEELQSEE